MKPCKATLDFPLEIMEAYGKKVIDAINRHHAHQQDRKPVAMSTREEMDKLFLEDIPESPTDAFKVLQFILENVMTESTVVSHPKAYSFVPGPSNYIGAMGDALASGFNIFSGGWAASPAAAELEIVTITWLLKLFGFPLKKGGGIFTSGGSMANLTAIVTARRLKCGEDFSKGVIYLSDQAHSSNIKALRILGFRKEQIRIVPTDQEFRFGVSKLKNAIAKDRLEGWQPFCLIATAGTTNTGTVDPLDELAAICKQNDLWFHIDGAYGGAAILAKDGKRLLKGISKADSLTVDPHKWFYQPYEIGCLLVRNHKWLRGTFTEKPEYLRDVEGNESEVNFYDLGVELTRRFRALKFYMSVKTFGMSAFRDAVDYNIALTERVEKKLRNSPHWEVISSATLAVINFRFNPIEKNYNEKQLDDINQFISNKVMESQEALLVTTVLNKQIVLRMCLINPRTTLQDVEETLALCEKFASQYMK